MSYVMAFNQIGKVLGLLKDAVGKSSVGYFV